MRTVLVTGAAGNVGRMLRPGLGDVQVRAVDAREPVGWEGAETIVGDLAEPSFAASVIDGVDAIVHLAANPAPYASWADLRNPNADAVANVVDAARDAGVPKVVLASSVHAMGGYAGPGRPLIDPAWPVRPCCRYGATKAFAEAYGHAVAATSETSVICLRLGACLPLPVDACTLRVWLGPADLQRLVRAALDADVAYGTYFGVSANTNGDYDIANARRELGYEPQLDAETHARGLPKGDLGGGLCRLDRSVG